MTGDVPVRLSLSVSRCWVDWRRGHYEVDFGTAGVSLDTQWIEGFQVRLGIGNEQECLVRTTSVLSIGECELKLEDIPSSEWDGRRKRLFRFKAVIISC